MNELSGHPDAVRQALDKLTKEVKRLSDLIDNSLDKDDMDYDLSSNDVIEILGISKATLNRLRRNHIVSFRYIAANQVVYPFKHLFLAILKGRLQIKGMSKSDAILRLKIFKANLPSKSSIEQNQPFEPGGL